MNIELVRKLDFYLGIPLCLIGSLLKKVGGALAFARKPGPPRNVLFIELSEMGSVVLADPAMVKLKRSLNANLHFAIFRKNSASLKLLDTVPRENVFVMGDAGIFEVVADCLRFFFWARAKGIDTVVDLELFSRFTALLTGISGATRTVGFHAFYNEGLYRGNFLTHKVAYNPHQHISKNFIALVNALLSGEAQTPYSKTAIADEELALRKAPVADEARQALIDRIGRACPEYRLSPHQLVLLNTNASDLVPLRRWPQAHYVKLARMILESHPNVVILLTGSKAERAGKAGIEREIGSARCVNFAGETELLDLPVLYSLSAFMLTNDSGPAHFASVTQMPAFVFFGPETPAVYGPLGTMTPIYAGLACSPCVSASNHRKSACRDNVCLQVITPEQVFEILKPALELPGSEAGCQKAFLPFSVR